MDTQIVETTVATLITQRKPFSAFDITKAVRALGQRARHDDVKNVVHGIFRTGRMQDFLQTLVQYPGAPTAAFLYHPQEVNPNDPATLTAIVNGQPVPTTPVADGDDDDDEEDDAGDDDDAGATPTATGTTAAATFVPTTTVRNVDGSVSKNLGTYRESVLRVSRELTRAIGVNPYGHAYAAIEPQKITLASNTTQPNQQAGLIRVTTVQADKDGDIRIRKTMMAQAGFGREITLKIENGEIIISNAQVPVTAVSSPPVPDPALVN
jgi:hypothetical protein